MTPRASYTLRSWLLPSTLSCALVACAPSTSALDGGDSGSTPESSVPADASVGPEFERPFDPGITPMSNEPRTIHVTLSSEQLGQRGFDYTPTPAPDQIVFVDGWEVRFDQILVTVGNVRLNLPGNNPSDPMVLGAEQARERRAFAVDAKKMGAFTAAGGGSDTAIPLFAFRTDSGGRALDPMIRYAVSFDTLRARGDATNVNLTRDQFADYNEMIARGWTLLLTGTATYRGVQPMPGSPEANYPTRVRFRYGLGAPASYVNCQNPENGADGAPGVAPRTTGAARAQITLHMDHLFWLRLNVEDPPPRFDHFAARATPGAMGDPALSTLDDLMGVPATNIVDRMMLPVPDRGGQTRGYTAMSSRLIAESNGAPLTDNDLRAFVAFSSRAMVHMNADGLCAVRPSGTYTF
jgi:hypothetical protein